MSADGYEGPGGSASARRPGPFPGGPVSLAGSSPRRARPPGLDSVAPGRTSPNRTIPHLASRARPVRENCLVPRARVAARFLRPAHRSVSALLAPVVACDPARRSLAARRQLPRYVGGGWSRGPVGAVGVGPAPSTARDDYGGPRHGSSVHGLVTPNRRGTSPCETGRPGPQSRRPDGAAARETEAAF